jgi:acetylornithine deacetylase/succinyl-diaminopimelate desuccinylase-like protein
MPAWESTTHGSKQQAVHLLTELVSINSVNPVFDPQGAGEAEVADHVEQYCREAGLDVSRQNVLPGRDNVLASIRVPGARRTTPDSNHGGTR